LIGKIWFYLHMDLNCMMYYPDRNYCGLYRLQFGCISFAHIHVGEYRYIDAHTHHIDEDAHTHRCTFKLRWAPRPNENID